MSTARTFETAAFKAVVGNKVAVVVRSELSAAQVAFLREETTRETRNAVRRGALPLVRNGGRLRVDGLKLAEQLHEADELLAVQYLRGWLEGLFELPVAQGEDDPPQDQMEHRYLLRQALGSSGVSNASVAGLQRLSEQPNRNSAPVAAPERTNEPAGSTHDA